MILGSTGYLGHKVIEKAIKKGWQVVCLVRNTSDISELQKFSKNIHAICINDYLLSKGLDTKIDVLYNFAAKYQHPGVENIEILHANFYIPAQIFLKSLELQISRFITIDTSLPRKINFYSFSKKLFAEFGQFFSESNNLTRHEFINAELEYFYGEDEPENRFIPWLLNNLFLHNPIDLTDGLQKRDFIYIDDVVSILLHLAEIKEFPAYLNFPIGTGCAPTIREIVEYLKTVTNSRSPLNFGTIAKRPGEPSTQANLSTMRAYNISINYNWKRGMEKMAKNWERNHTL